MKLTELRAHAAWNDLTDAERREVTHLLDNALELDDVAVEYFDGDPKGLTAADLRAWLETTRQRPFPFVGTESLPTESQGFFDALMKSVGADGRGAASPTDILRVRSLTTMIGLAEHGRRASGYVPEEELAAITLQIDHVGRGLSPKVVHEAMNASNLGDLSTALIDYHRGTTGLARWLDGAVRTVETAVLNGRAGLLMVGRGAPNHEGHFDGTRWRNWTESYSARPARFVVPRTEAELCAAVAESERARVVGGGHSFNDSPLTDGTMISLDAYNRVLAIDPVAKTARVQGGIRLRDLNKVLDASGLSLPVLGSTDAQSLAALVSTDLHGTGRDHGFLSEQILSLRLVSAAGVAQTVKPGEMLFHAAIGAIGTVGVVCEVELQLVPAFRLRKTARIVDRAWAEANLEKILSEHHHVSFYYPAGADETRSARMHTWDHVDDPPDADWQSKMANAELSDFALSGFAPAVIEQIAVRAADDFFTKLLSPEKSIVSPASRGFGRRLFYRHDEIEFGLPFESYRAALEEVLSLLRKRDYFSVVETRFTPDTSRALLGPGVGRRTAYIELATPMSQPTAEVYAEVEAIFRTYKGQPHLGKKTSMTSQDMLQIYGQRFIDFQELRRAQDPSGKFANRFIEQVF